MRRLTRSAAVGATALVLIANCAVAQDSLFRNAFPKKTQSCFKRIYNTAHLTGSPGQSVTGITLSRGPAELKREAIEGPEAPSFAFRLSLTLRGGTGAGPEPVGCDSRQASEGEHGGKPFLQCASSCGRGHFDLLAEGADRVTITIGGTVQGRFIADAIGVGRSCTADTDLVWLGDEAGDRTFVLERAPLKECLR